MATTMPFSKASRVIILRQLRPERIMAKSASTWSAHCLILISLRVLGGPAARDTAMSRPTASCIAGAEAEPGSDMPTASLKADMVLAVNMPPQEPGQGVACSSISCSSSMSITPPEYAPTASNAWFASAVSWRLVGSGGRAGGDAPTAA